VRSSLAGVNFAGALLDDADLRGTDLRDIQWRSLKSVKGANIADVKNAPAGFVEWARANGALE